jgi:hypothetical protein
VSPEPKKAAPIVETKKTAEAPAGGTSPPKDDAWQNAVDVLKLVKPERDAVEGKWSLQHGVLTSTPIPKSKTYPRLALPYVPPAEYDLRIVFTRAQGEDCLFVHLVREERQFAWMLGAWKNTVVGFDTFQGKRARDFPENTRTAPVLESRRRYTVVVQVRSGSVRCFLDGALASESSAPASDFGLAAHWALPKTNCLGLGNPSSTIEIHSCQVLEVTGTGRAGDTAGK